MNDVSLSEGYIRYENRKTQPSKIKYSLHSYNSVLTKFLHYNYK